MSRKEQFLWPLETKNINFSHVLVFPSSRTNDALAETRQGNERELLEREERERERERRTSLGEKIEFDIFVRFSLAARARVKISDDDVSPSFCVACEARISYLHGPGPRPPVFPPP